MLNQLGRVLFLKRQFAEAVEQFKKVHEWMVLCCGYIEQKAAAAAMEALRQIESDDSLRVRKRERLLRHLPNTAVCRPFS